MKNVNLFKNKKENDNQPDYRMSAFDGESNYDVGACWVKEDKNGGKFLSCKLKDEYQDKPGFHLAEEKTAENVSKPQEEAGEPDQDIPF